MKMYQKHSDVIECSIFTNHREMVSHALCFCSIQSLHFLLFPFFSCAFEKRVEDFIFPQPLHGTIVSSTLSDGEDGSSSLNTSSRRRSKERAFLSARQSLAVLESVTVCFRAGPSSVSLTLRVYLTCFFSLVNTQPPSTSAYSTVRALFFACG